MLLEQFLIETRYLTLAHFYFSEKKLTLFNSLKDQHSHFQTYDLTHATQPLPFADILFVEIGDSSKEKLKLLLSIFTKHKPIMAYLFAQDVENRLLLKFALHFGSTDVLPLKNDTSLLASIFTQNANKLDEKLYTFQKIELEKKIEHFFPFLVFQGKTLTYANGQAKKLYATTSLSDIQNKIYSDEELSEVLHSNEDAEGSIVIENESNERHVYLCIIKSFPKSDEKIVTLVNYDPEEETKNCSTILNRFDFIDRLKDRLAQQSVTNTAISLIFVHISNLDKLSKTFTSTTLYETFKNLLIKLAQLKEEGQEIVQWSPNLYIVLGEDQTFEHTCDQTRHIQQELINHTINEKITPIIISSAFQVESKDMNEVIDYIEKINTKNLLPQDIAKIKYYELEYLEHVIEENEQIAYLMYNCINNKIPIKLLNIYKGLCINTNSHILKRSDESYYLHCENLQGYAMQLESETILQAPNFPKDIKAEVSLIDIKRSLVIIKNLSFMPNSANSRQHTRVQTNIRTPILIKYAQHSSAQGDILDISVNSIAIKVKKNFRKEEIVNHHIKLNFSLPDEEGEHGYVIMDIAAKVISLIQKEDHTKVIVMLDNLPKPYDSYLLRYMYSRQKELIAELKRATKAYN